LSHVIDPVELPRPSPSGARQRREPTWLFERYQRERRPADREQIVLRYMPLARHLARRYATRAEHDDLQQVAAIGLMKAVDRFDPNRGIAFSTFAVPTILGEIKRHFRDLGWSVRVPRDLQELALRVERVAERLTSSLGRSPTVTELAEACEASPEQVLEARSTATAHRAISLDQPAHEDGDDGPVQFAVHEEPGYARAELAADLDRLLSHLDQRERMVLHLRFQEDLVQREIAERMGISQMQVSRMLAKAIATLQQHRGPSASQPR
jgi:RNA polymerase sigma-B factor